MTNKQLIRELRKNILKGYGKPCQDPCVFCATCIAHRVLKEMTEIIEITELPCVY